MAQSRSSLSLSVNSRQPRIAAGVKKASPRALSPESEEGMASLAQHQDTSRTNTLPLVEDQDVDMDADDSSDSVGLYGLTPSPSPPTSQSDYGVYSDLEDPNMNASSSHAVQVPLEAQEAAISSLPAQQLPPSVEAEIPIGNSSSVRQDLKMDVSPPRNPSQSEDWEWGKPAPSSSNTRVQQGQGSAREQVPEREQQDRPDQSPTEPQGQGSASEQVPEQEQHDASDQESRITISAATIYRGEAVRLRRLYTQVNSIYGREIRLGDIIEAMIEELDMEEVRNYVE